jgi:hypothetical protein
MWFFLVPLIYLVICPIGEKIVAPPNAVYTTEIQPARAIPKVKSASEPEVPAQVPQAIPVAKSPA